MSNRDREIDDANLLNTLTFFFRQSMKEVYTAMPGVVDEYNPITKRARVHGAVNVQLTNGQELTRPPIVNVPVLHPSGGGFMMHMPLRAGDAVMLLFSMRGIAAFKRTYRDATPTTSSFFAASDAVAIPGFGGLQVRPATAEGVTIQSEDGQDYIFVERGRINVVTPGNVMVQAGSASVTATGDISLDGANIRINATTGVTITAPAVDINQA